MTAIRYGLLIAALLLFRSAGAAFAAPAAEPWSFWAANDPAGKARVDHAPWDAFLKKHVVTNHPSGVNRVRYASVAPEDRKNLDGYILQLQQVEVARLHRRAHVKINRYGP